MEPSQAIARMAVMTAHAASVKESVSHNDFRENVLLAATTVLRSTSAMLTLASVISIESGMMLERRREELCRYDYSIQNCLLDERRDPMRILVMNEIGRNEYRYEQLQ